MVDAEELDAAPDRVRRVHHARVGVELLEVVERPALDRRLDQMPVLVRRPRAELVPAGADAAGEVRDHRAAVVGEEAQVGVPVEDAREHDARHERRGLVRPAERPPDLVPRAVLRLVVGERAVAARMDADRAVQLCGLREDRLELRLVPGTAADVGVDLDADRAELADRALQLGDARVDVVQRQLRDPAGERVRMPLDELRLTLVRNLCQLDRRRRVAHVLERWRRQARDLTVVVAELLELAALEVEVDDRGDRADPRADVLRGGRLRQAQQTLRICAGQEVGERVDLHGRCRRRRRTLGNALILR